ncbi:MAG: putative aminohydrolase SsnA [Spirochaetes bacterium]|nr:putative aminohydrolase SsnA [Spirochaetota bacterium]
MSKKIIGNGLLIPLGNHDIIEKGGVYIEENLIRDFGPTDKLLKRYHDFEYIDAREKVIMPGLVCAHHHLYSTFACGLAFRPAENFVRILENLWWKLDKALTLEDVYYSALVTLLKCIRNGTTTIIDHHASPHAISGSLDKLKQAVKKVGLRACLCYELTDRDGKKGIEKGMEENIRFIEKFGSHQDDQIAASFGMHASMTLSDETLKQVKKLTGHRNTGYHIHVAEDKADVDDCLKKYNKRIVERLSDRGLLNDRTIAAHCIHINEKEMEILADNKCFVANNPSSNMNNAVGTADILKMFKKKVIVGLGTDGMTSNMFEEVKTAYLIQHHTKKDPRVAFIESINMLLNNNPKIASKLFNHKMGVIDKEAFADIIIVDYFPYTPLNQDNFAGHFVFGIGSSPVDTTIINGKIIMLHKDIIGVDEREISREAYHFAKEVWKRFQAADK